MMSGPHRRIDGAGLHHGGDVVRVRLMQLEALAAAGDERLVGGGDVTRKEMTGDDRLEDGLGGGETQLVHLVEELALLGAVH